MKPLFYLILLLFFSHTTIAQKQIKTLADFEREYVKKAQTPLAERLNIHPFDKTVKVVLISVGYNATMSSGYKGKRDSVDILPPYIRPIELFEKGFHLAEQIVPIKNPDSIAILSNILINTCAIEDAFRHAELAYKDYKESLLKNRKRNAVPTGIFGPRKTVGCYTPRNMIVFYDYQDNVVEYMEICFQCDGTYRTKSGKRLNVLDCDLQTKLLVNFLNEHRIITNFQQANEFFGKDFKRNLLSNPD